ncbi:MAG TPA: hypothetical protein VFW33_14675 [Gemmataceae bacterium]|nr:hypothetical protein [Gemmataceae bacterium]
MTPERRIQENNATYWKLRPVIDQTYPKGWAVAIDGGRIIADASSFEELEARLMAQGDDSREILVAQVGFEHPQPGDYLGSWTLVQGDDTAS